MKRRKEELGYIDGVGVAVIMIFVYLFAIMAVSLTQIYSITIPWKIIGISVGALVAAAVLFFAAVLLYRYVKHVKENKKQKTKSDNLSQQFWEKTFHTHDSLLRQWGQYELNVEELIRYPLMTDASDPHTKHLLETIHEAEILRPQKADLSLDVSKTSYGKAVKELSSALNAAVANAKRKAWNGFTHQEQSKLNTALQMLNLAQDAGASVHERQAAYKRVLAEVEGLIYLPEKPVSLLESTVLKTIEAPSHSQPSLVLN